MNTQKAIEKMKSINLEYDYSKFIFKNYTTKSIIICKYHGEFNYSYNNAIRSRTKIFCKECLKEYNRLNNKFIFLENMKNKFPELDFSKFKYKDEKTHGIVICKEHGELLLSPNRLKNSKYGCQYCSNKRIKDPLSKLKSIHPNYDFPNFKYINNSIKYDVICPIHGKFNMMYQHLVKGHGCNKCGRIKSSKNISKSKSYSKEQAITKMSDKFPNLDFSKFDYKNKRTSSYIKCKKHDIIFKSRYYRVMDKRTIFLCPKCKKSGYSKAEKEIVEFIRSIYNNTVEENNTSIIKNEYTNYYLELDIYLPDINLAIEFNGRYWHSDEIISKRTNNIFKSTKEYHNYKSKKCKEKGIKLIHIDEEDYLKNKSVILNNIKENVLKITERI